MIFYGLHKPRERQHLFAGMQVLYELVFADKNNPGGNFNEQQPYQPAILQGFAIQLKVQTSGRNGPSIFL